MQAITLLFSLCMPKCCSNRPPDCSIYQLCFPVEVPPLTSSPLQAGIPVEENILLCLVDIWLDKVDNVSSVQKRIFGFTLSIILTMRLNQVLDKLDQILSVCTNIILGGNDDLVEEESGDDNMRSIRSHGEGTFPSKELKETDPVNQLSLENTVRENLQICATFHGESFLHLCN